MLKNGDWIKIKCETAEKIIFWHHAIVSDINNQKIRIIHVNNQMVQEIYLETFLECGKDAEIVTDYEPRFSSENIVKRAKSYIGKRDDDLPIQNGELFVSWCYRGNNFNINQMAKYGVIFTWMSIYLGFATLLCSVLALCCTILSKISD
jgi:hypothetical protein